MKHTFLQPEVWKNQQPPNTVSPCTWKNADQYNLLPKNEIDQRRKENTLSLVKKLLLERTSLRDIVPYINEAFVIIKPKNFREFLLFFLSKILKRL